MNYHPEASSMLPDGILVGQLQRNIALDQTDTKSWIGLATITGVGPFARHFADRAVAIAEAAVANLGVADFRPMPMIEVGKDLVAALIVRGDVALRDGDYDQAIADFGAVVHEYDTDDLFGARFGLAGALLLSGRFREMVDAVQSWDPDDAGTLWTRALAAVLRRGTGARSSVQKAVDANPLVMERLLSGKGTRFDFEQLSPAPGSDVEARTYLRSQECVWRRIPGSLQSLNALALNIAYAGPAVSIEGIAPSTSH